MKVRDKIILILLPVILVIIFAMNSIFIFYFDSFLKDQEAHEITHTCTALYDTIVGKLHHYQRTVDDWGHWGNTYEYISGQTSVFTAFTYREDIFVSHEISFAILRTTDNRTVYRQFYDFDEKSFAAFPSGFFDDFDRVLQPAVDTGSNAAIYRLGEALYFVALSDVTDPHIPGPSAGTLFIGRKIDHATVSTYESIAESRLLSIDVTPPGMPMAPDAAPAPYSYQISPGNTKDTMEFTLTIPGSDDTNTIILKFASDRTMFFSQMQQVRRFILLIFLGILCFTSILFFMLSTFMSKPIANLVKDINRIDYSEKEITKISVSGKDEFAFLRTTINTLLLKIEHEQGKVKDNEEKLRAILVSVGDGVIVVDRDHAVQFLNPVAQKLTGWSQEEALGEPSVNVFNIINEYTREKVPSPVAEVYAKERIIELANHTSLIAKDGQERPIEDTAAPVRDKHGMIVGCVIVFRDFSEKKEKQKKIEYLSYHDQLTGLFNRRYFDQSMERLDIPQNLPLSFIYADVNGLKIINDAFGHQAGDELIQRVAEVFKTTCRPSDIIARTGGDEFIILLPNTDPTEVKKLEKCIRSKIETQQIMGVNISLSLGWNTKAKETESAWEVLKITEDHMYQKKILTNTSKRSDVIKSILNTLHLKCPREEAHSQRVSMICESIGKAYGISGHELAELKMAGKLHDIGKIAVDKSILNKKEKLTKPEWAQIRSHPETGYRILGTSSEYYNISEYVLAHHERWDGLGYPKGVAGEDIHWKARIIAIADAYDAMIFERPYRKALRQQDIIAEIRKNAGTQFDPDIARVFVEEVLGETW